MSTFVRRSAAVAGLLIGLSAALAGAAHADEPETSKSLYLQAGSCESTAWLYLGRLGGTASTSAEVDHCRVSVDLACRNDSRSGTVTGSASPSVGRTQYARLPGAWLTCTSSHRLTNLDTGAITYLSITV